MAICGMINWVMKDGKSIRNHRGSENRNRESTKKADEEAVEASKKWKQPWPKLVQKRRRPGVPCHHIRVYRYVYGAIAPLTGESHFLIMPTVTVDVWMSFWERTLWSISQWNDSFVLRWRCTAQICKADANFALYTGNESHRTNMEGNTAPWISEPDISFLDSSCKSAFCRNDPIHLFARMGCGLFWLEMSVNRFSGRCLSGFLSFTKIADEVLSGSHLLLIMIRFVFSPEWNDIAVAVRPLIYGSSYVFASTVWSISLMLIT